MRRDRPERMEIDEGESSERKRGPALVFQIDRRGEERVNLREERRARIPFRRIELATRVELDDPPGRQFDRQLLHRPDRLAAAKGDFSAGIGSIFSARTMAPWSA